MARHIAETRRIIDRQVDLIAGLVAIGGDVAGALDELDEMRASLRLLESRAKALSEAA